MDISFCFRFEKGCDIGLQPNGEETEVYYKIVLRNHPPMSDEEYKDHHEKIKHDLSKYSGNSIDLITPITYDEYIQNTEEDTIS